MEIMLRKIESIPSTWYMFYLWATLKYFFCNIKQTNADVKKLNEFENSIDVRQNAFAFWTEFGPTKTEKYSKK